MRCGACVEQAEDDRVGKCLPGGFDDVVRDPDRGPRPLAVGGVDQHPGNRCGPGCRVKHADLEVGQVDTRKLWVAWAEGLAQGSVEGIYGPVPFGYLHNALVTHVELEPRLCEEAPILTLVG